MLPSPHRLRLYPALLAAGAVLAACTAGPDFAPPAPPAVASFTAHADRLGSTSQRIVPGAAVTADWWRAFGCAPLDRTMSAALAHNDTLAAARASLAAAQEEERAAAGALWPQISLGGVAGRQKYGVSLFGPTHFVIPPFTYYTVGPQVSYLLDFAGAERRTVERRRALTQFQSYEVAATRLAVTGNILAQTLAIASARTQIGVLDRIVANDRKNLSLVEKARAAGSGTLPDVVSARSQLARDETLLPPLRQRASVAAHALAILAGDAPAQASAPALTLRDLHLPRDLPLSLPSKLVHSRPDILAAEAQLHAASAAVGIATADLYPQITLSANTTQQALSPGGLIDAGGNAWAMAAGLTAPLFDGGTVRARRRAAIDEYRAALADYRRIVMESFAQVADVLRALRNDDAEVRAEIDARKTAVDALALMRTSYREGASGVLGVLDAERQFNRSDLELARARAQRLQDTALLYLALGGGYSPPPQPHGPTPNG
ncbi:MAG TPA: efflux transporter outer membrane subunit [Steroidobacteraceae bacterium]|nr:efflux transporter outer membrane subunit [Steroidobacteraceae bacterium]